MDIINDKGKFEGSPTFVREFWDRALEGFSHDTMDVNGHQGSVFNITPEDRKLFPDLKGIDMVVVWEDDQGFVLHGEFTKADLVTVVSKPKKHK